MLSLDWPESKGHLIHFFNSEGSSNEEECQETLSSVKLSEGGAVEVHLSMLRALHS